MRIDGSKNEISKENKGKQAEPDFAAALPNRNRLSAGMVYP